MNTIANRRALAEAVQKIVKSNVLQPEDFAAACQALGQVFTDTMGVPCQVHLALPKNVLKEAAACKKVQS